MTFQADRADQRAEDHVVVDDRGVDDALADGRGDLQLEQQDRDEVEEGRPHDRLVGLQHAGGDDGRDRVRGVVEAVHEVEDERHDDQHDDRGGERADIQGRSQPFSSTTPSITSATSWHLSVVSSMQLVDRLELDELAHVLLLAEQAGDRGAHDAVGVGLERVDLLADLEDRGAVVHRGEHA